MSATRTTGVGGSTRQRIVEAAYACMARDGIGRLTRLVLSFGFRPPDWFDATDAAAVHHLVHTYALPAIKPTEVTPS